MLLLPRMNAYLDLLRSNRNYRNLWLATLVSYAGDWFNLLASAALIARLTNSGTALSLLFVARFLPLFLFSPLGGILADRYSRRGLLMATDVLRTITVLAFLLIRSADFVWLFYTLTVVQFALSALFTPARNAIVPNIVSDEELVTANALDGFTWSAMLAVGALLGGLATEYLGVAAAFVLDAATFLLSAWFVSRLVLPQDKLGSAERTTSEISSGWLEFVDGLRYLRGRPVILGIALAKALGTLAWGGVNVLEIELAEKVFPLAGSGTLSLTVIYLVAGIGTGFGPLAVRALLGDERRRALWVIGFSFATFALGIAWMGFVPSLLWFAIATLVRTLGTGTLWVFSSALLQRLTTDKLRGRVFAFEFAMLTFAQTLAVFWAGYAPDNLGWTLFETMRSLALIAVVVTALWYFFQRFALRQPLMQREVAVAPLPVPGD